MDRKFDCRRETVRSKSQTDLLMCSGFQPNHERETLADLSIKKFLTSIFMQVRCSILYLSHRGASQAELIDAGV